MARELSCLDVRLTVSVWPLVNPGSAVHDRFAADGFLVRRSDGTLARHVVVRAGGPAATPRSRGPSG